jgi:hypothetical protein
MKRERLMPVVIQPVPVAAELKREPSLLKLLRMRSDVARRQRVTGAWTANVNIVSQQS